MLVVAKCHVGLPQCRNASDALRATCPIGSQQWSPIVPCCSPARQHGTFSRAVSRMTREKVTSLKTLPEMRETKDASLVEQEWRQVP